MFLKTPAAAELLSVSYWALIGLLRTRRIVPPEKDSSGDYVWSEIDIDRARKALSATKLTVKGARPRA